MTFAFGYAVINSSAKHAVGTSQTASTPNGIRYWIHTYLPMKRSPGNAPAIDPSPLGQMALLRHHTSPSWPGATFHSPVGTPQPLHNHDMCRYIPIGPRLFEVLHEDIQLCDLKWCSKEKDIETRLRY